MPAKVDAKGPGHRPVSGKTSPEILQHAARQMEPKEVELILPNELVEECIGALGRGIETLCDFREPQSRELFPAPPNVIRG